MSDRPHELLWVVGLALAGCLAFIFAVGTVETDDVARVGVIVAVLALAWELHVHHDPHRRA